MMVTVLFGNEVECGSLTKVRWKIRPGFVIDGGLHPDPVFAEPVSKPADAGPDFNNACEIVAKQLKGSYEFIGEKHKGLPDVGLPDHHGEQLFFSVEVPGFDPLAVGQYRCSS